MNRRQFSKVCLGTAGLLAGGVGLGSKVIRAEDPGSHELGVYANGKKVGYIQAIDTKSFKADVFDNDDSGIIVPPILKRVQLSNVQIINERTGEVLHHD